MTTKRNIFLVLGCLAVAAGAMAYLFLHPSAQSAALSARQHAMELLGARIAKLRPECKVLLLANPFARKSGYLNEKSQYDRASLNGLRKGLGARMTVEVAYPDILEEYEANPQAAFIPRGSRTPLSFLMQPASVDRLAEAHPECCVIVSLIGLPAGVERLKGWNEKDRRCFALLSPDFRLLGPPAEVIAAFRRQKLLIAIFEGNSPAEPLIITQENIAELLERQPKLFGY